MGVCDSVTKSNISDSSFEKEETSIRKENKYELSNEKIKKKKKSFEKIENNKNDKPKESRSVNYKKKRRKNSITIGKINKEKRAKTLEYVEGKKKEEEEKNDNNNLEINTRLIINCNNKNPKDQYKIITKLGKGAFGTVWKVRNINTGLFRAMKRIKKMRNNINKINEIVNEIEILKNLDHPNIVKIFEFFIEADGYYIITEYCNGGELFQAIKLNGFFSEDKAANIIYQVFNAMNYCHNTNKVIHRD